jgi:hypothetical protein
LIRPRPFWFQGQPPVPPDFSIERTQAGGRFEGVFSGCTTKTGRPARIDDPTLAMRRIESMFGALFIARTRAHVRARASLGADDDDDPPPAPALPFRTPLADVAQLVEHFTRNEGVPGSSPGVGFWGLQGFLASGSARALLGGT